MPLSEPKVYFALPSFLLSCLAGIYHNLPPLTVPMSFIGYMSLEELVEPHQ